MKNNENWIQRYVTVAVCVLAISEAILMLSSWIISTAFPSTGLRSLINSEGIRWFLGGFTANLCNDISAWVLLSAMAFGCVARSGIHKSVNSMVRRKPMSFRERLALALASMEIVAILVVMLLLSCVPQAILLSATGRLFPSSFSRSVLPVIDFSIVITTVTYGVVTDNITNMQGIVDCLVYGCQKAAPVFVLYAFACQLVCSLDYVLAL